MYVFIHTYIGACWAHQKKIPNDGESDCIWNESQVSI